MYYRFGVEGSGTNFIPFGLVKAESKEEASEKINKWASEQSKETLESYLYPNDKENGVEPRVCLDYDCNNFIKIVI